MKYLVLTLVSSTWLFLPLAEEKAKPHLSAKDALSQLNGLVGEWRGIGQLKRGSRKGAWTEKTKVAWSFRDESPAIWLSADGGQQFQQLKLSWLSTTQEVAMSLTLKDETFAFTGTLPKEWPGKLQLISKPNKDGQQLRCTIQQLSDIRSTVLLEKRTSATGSFRRTAAVGYTRAGERLAVAGGNTRKCIVTGGTGTIAVSHNGKTYYVCCQGCLQAFNDAPDAIVAEYKASLKKTAK